MISKSMQDALVTISNALEDADTNWVLVGSASLCLQGVNIEPHDIDILTDREGAYRIGSILKEYEVKEVEYSESEKFRSHFGIFDIGGVKVEVMGDLQNKVSEGDLWSDTSSFSEKKYLNYGGLEIPVIGLEREYEVYVKMGRNEKAEKIRKVLEED